MNLADIRLQNALLLRDHHVRKWRADGDERARTAETSFARLIDVNPAHWSQIKSKHRHIGTKLARQIESKCRVPQGSLDASDAERLPVRVLPPTVPYGDDEERNAVQLFLTLFRMNKPLAKARLLDALQAELLTTEPAGRAADAAPGRVRATTLRRVR
jgi:hypothetical protein